MVESRRSLIFIKTRCGKAACVGRCSTRETTGRLGKNLHSIGKLLIDNSGLDIGQERMLGQEPRKL
jgi:hypothetical protein